MHLLTFTFTIYISHGDHFSLLRYFYNSKQAAVTNESQVILFSGFTESFGDVTAIFFLRPYIP